MSIQKAKSSVHVTIAATPFLDRWCQKFTPERGNRLPWHGSAINRISHISSIVNASAGICRYGGSWAACAARFQKGIFHALIGHFPGLPGLALPLAPPGACVAVCGFPHMREAPVLSWPPIGASVSQEERILGGGHSFAMRPGQQAPLWESPKAWAVGFSGAFRAVFPSQITGFLRTRSTRFFVFILSRLEPVENVSGLFSLPPYDYLITTTKENDFCRFHFVLRLNDTAKRLQPQLAAAVSYALFVAAFILVTGTGTP